MSWLLNIDTTSETALVNVAWEGKVLFEETNDAQKDHAAFIHPAIQTVIKKTGIALNDINAIAVSIGPGSYTGIRVGVATAKGLCFATGKPLITLNELEIIAKGAIDNYNTSDVLYCPMIDARRQEVFTALYDNNLHCIQAPTALILNNQSFASELHNQKILFCGNGASKWKAMNNHANSRYINFFNKGFAIANLSYKKYFNNNFSSVAYSSPLYIKDFHTTNPAV